MRESFMKYDRDNPPAGVNECGVFTGGGGGSGGGGVFLIRVTSVKNDGGEWVDAVDKSYAEIEAAHNAGLWLYLYAGSNGAPYIFSGWWERETPKYGFVFEFKSVDSDVHYQIWEDDTLTKS